MSKEIAETILEQLGGNKFIAMTGAKNFSFSADPSDRYPALSFRIGKNRKRITRIKIMYDTVWDLYIMIFYEIFKNEVKSTERIEDVSADQLQEFFTDRTGLLTHL